MPDPQQQAAAPAPAPPPSIFDTLAQQDTQKIQHDQAATQPNDIFDQIAMNGGSTTPPKPPPGTPTMGPGPQKGIIGKTLEKISDTKVPGTGVTVGEAGNNAEEFARIAGGTALALGGGPEGGTAGILAKGGKAAEEIVQGSKWAHIFDEAETAGAVDKVGKIPGLLKSAYDWAKANPVKTYLLYKIADQAGLGLSGIKKLVHLVSGGEE